MFDDADALAAAEAVARSQLAKIAVAVGQVVGRIQSPPETIVLAGRGEFVARRVLERMKTSAKIISLDKELGAALSRSATAHALAVIAARESRAQGESEGLGTITVRIIKLGGSLLDWPDWPARFRQWLSRQSAAVNILIVGGGTLADDVRRRDAKDGLDASTAHWLAIDAMSANIIAARQLLHEAVSVDRWEDLQKPIADGDLIAFCPREFLRRIEADAPGPRLPHGWDVTSDSIAARLAVVLGVQELVLLKSAVPPLEATTLQQAADVDYVDRCFPQFAVPIPIVRFCNLRSEEFAEWRPQ